MSNEHYLIVSYFVVGLVSGLAGFFVYLALKNPLARITEIFPRKQFAGILRILFPIGLILPALTGFLVVRYQVGCNEKPYSKLIADRNYLVYKNQQQLSSSATQIAVALLIWGLIILLGLLRSRRGQNGE